MATFNNLGLQEPSTITARVATVTVSRGSTTEHQEIMVLGDSDSSNGLARILNVAPVSTDWGLVVRPVGASTTVNVSSVGGVVTVTPQSSAWQVQVTNQSTTANISSVAGVVTVAPQSSAWQVQVTNPSTIVAVSSVGGVVAVAQNSTIWAVQLTQYSTQVSIGSFASLVSSAVQAGNSSALTVRNVWSSTNADQPVSAAQAGTWTIGTVTAVSSLAGIVTVRPSDTNWASSAGFHFDSSGALLTVASFTGSTTVTVSQLLDSSGGSIAVGDNVNQALRVNIVAGSASSTIVSVSSVAGNVRVVNSSAADLQATVTQASTVWAVQVGGYSTTANVSSVAGKVSVVNSSAADLLASVAQTSTVWAVQLTQYSTIAAISSVAGVVTVQQNSTVWAVQLANYSTVVSVSTGSVRVHQSTAADLHMTAHNADGAGNALESSTSAPSSGARGLLVRPILGGVATYSASTTGQSSATTILSSAATSRGYVFAYSITSTLAGPVEWGIYSGSTRLWGGVLAATSSAISGVNLAVSPPGYLFSGSTGQALTFNVASSNTGLNVSIAYWQST